MENRALIVILSSILLILTGCAAESAPAETFHAIYDNYSVSEEGENWLVNITNEATISQADQQVLASLSFDSLEDMRNRIMNNLLTEGELAIMQSSFPKTEDGNVIVPNMNDLYQPILPDDLGCAQVGLCGTTYTFHLDANSLLGSGYVHFYDDEAYDNVFAEQYTNFFDNERITVVESWQDEDRSSTVTLYTTNAGTFHHVIYTISNNGKDIIVSETYCIESKNSILLKASDTVPYRMNVFVQDNGNKCRIYLTRLTERPSVEWLSSFGVEEYVVPDTTVAE